MSPIKAMSHDAGPCAIMPITCAFVGERCRPETTDIALWRMIR
jgi:hypothetical protein